LWHIIFQRSVRFFAGEDLHYGWIEMSLDDSDLYTLTIHSWVYETQPGVGITFGVVPEPSTWALFLIGVACLACGRRHMKEHHVTPRLQ